MHVELIQPIAMEEGLRVAIRRAAAVGPGSSRATPIAGPFPQPRRLHHRSGEVIYPHE